jgi:hypothetical protein
LIIDGILNDCGVGGVLLLVIVLVWCVLFGLDGECNSICLPFLDNGCDICERLEVLGLVLVILFNASA